MNHTDQKTWRGIRIAAIAITALLIVGMAYIGFSSTRVRPVSTPTKTPTAVGQETPTPAGDVTIVHIATSTSSAGTVPAYTPTPTQEGGPQPTPTSTGVPSTATTTATAISQENQSPLPLPDATATTAAGANATATSIAPRPDQSPLPSPDSATPTATTPATAVPVTTMVVCGYDRCRDSSEYGVLSFESGISVWENPEPDRGDVIRELEHGDEVQIVAKKRIYDGAGGLWYQLEQGGWINDLWLTDQLCAPDNLPEYSFDRCSNE